ncbi:MAG: hypothetical protein ACO1PI_14110 [Bacteroidota bacterium]
MRTPILLILLSLSNQLLFSQAKWDVRLSINYLQCFSQVDKLQWESTKNRTEIKPYNYSPGRSMYINDIFGSKFPEISVFRTITPRNSVSVGYLDFNAYIGHSLKAGGELAVVGYEVTESVGLMPAIKLNHHYTIINPPSKNNKRLSLSLSSGLLIFFKGRESKYKTSIGTGRAEQVMYDFSGNYVETVYLERYLKEYKRPKPFTTCFNFGVNGNVALNKRFKIGADISTYISSGSLYSRIYYGESTDTKYTYEVKLKPYFFSGGIYLQYNIK